MHYLPFVSLGVGLMAGTGAAFFLACGHIVTRRMTTRAGELRRKGASAAVISRHLVAEGYDPEHSAKVAATVIHRAEIEIAAALLVEGHSQGETEERLMAAGMEPQKARDLVGEADLLRWCRRWRVLVAPVGLGLVALGMIVCAVGLVLRDGPGWSAMISKELTTFVGAAILSLGLVLLAGAFGRTF